MSQTVMQLRPDGMVRRLFPRSIRARLTTVATLIAAVVFTASAAITLATVPENLRGVVQARVELAVRRVAAEARAGTLPRVLETPSRVHMLQVVTADGRMLASSPGLAQGLRLTDLKPTWPDTIRFAERTGSRSP